MSNNPLELSCLVYYMIRQVSASDKVEFHKNDLLSVREICLEDLGAYKELYRRFGEAWLWIDRKNIGHDYFSKNIKINNVTFPCLFLGDEMVGFSEIKYKLYSGALEAEIVYFSVLSGFLGRGFGKILMKYLLNKFAQKGVSSVFLNTCTFDHICALNFYKGFDFEVYKVEEKKVSIQNIGKDIFESSDFYKRSLLMRNNG